MRRQPRQGGFVLVIVLALLVVLTLLASAVAVSGRQAVAEAQADVDGFGGELDILSTRETLLFMLATQRQTLGGLSVGAYAPPVLDDMDDANGADVVPVGNEIRLDSRPYAGLGNARFAIQDDRGLLSLNWTSPVLRQAFFATYGAADENRAGLEDKRLDYQDLDDLRRLDGAEADQYRKAGLPVPTNRALDTPLEYRRILQWDKLLSALDDAELLGMLTMTRSADINLNTAPASVLALIPGMDAEQAERMIALRTRVPMTSLYQVLASFPIAPITDGGLSLFSNTSGNLILWDRHLGVRHLTHWTMTPYQDGGPPWRIDYEVTLPRGNPSDQVVADPPATPLFAPPDPARP